jgi:DNA-binding transcriptional MerR regulator
MNTGLTIGQLGKATNTKVETVRYYERIGLLAAPGRTTGNYRTYDVDALARLSFVRRARDLGFSIDQVRELLDLAGQGQRDCGSVDVLANEHLAEIDRKLADLNALRRELGALITSCQGGTISECRILDALAPR